jgi:hypothetical protein
MSEREKLVGILDHLGITYVQEQQRIEFQADTDRVVLNFDGVGSFDHIRINDDVFQRASAVSRLLLNSVLER